MSAKLCIDLIQQQSFKTVRELTSISQDFHFPRQQKSMVILLVLCVCLCVCLSIGRSRQKSELTATEFDVTCSMHFLLPPQNHLLRPPGGSECQFSHFMLTPIGRLKPLKGNVI